MCAPKARLVFDLNGLCPKGHAIEDGTAELVGQALGDAVLLKLDLGRRRITVYKEHGDRLRVVVAVLPEVVARTSCSEHSLRSPVKRR